MLEIIPILLNQEARVYLVLQLSLTLPVSIIVLHIEKVDVDDVGNYTCIAKSGSQSLSSASAVLDLACKYLSSSY